MAAPALLVRTTTASIALLCSVAVAQPIALVKDGEATSIIVTSDQPSPVQRRAADELQHHLREMTGASVPIVTESELGSTSDALIYVGGSAALRQLGIDTASLTGEAFIVRTIDGALVLAGDDAGSREGEPVYGGARTGTLYAVYDFLQDELGCRWVWPGPTGEVIPQRRTVQITELAVQETPQLLRRHFRLGVRAEARQFARDYHPRYLRDQLDDMYETLMRDEMAWLKRMRMGKSDKPQYGHAFTDWYDRHLEQHPEVFALQADGTRGLPTDSYPRSFVKLCVSSDALLDLLIEQFEERRRRNPGHRWLNACENDGGLGFCVCDACRALDVTLNDPLRAKLQGRGWSDEQIEQQFRPGENGLPNSLSNRYFHFYNRLARRLAQIAPDAYVVAYAYAKYLYAPIDMKIEPNILVGLVGFNNYPMAAEDHRREVNGLQAWRDAGVKALFFRPNSFYFSIAHGVPWDATTQMAGDFRMLLDGGILSTDFDRLNGHWSTSARTYYVLARQHWDTESDVEYLKREFADAFGPAADLVDEYFNHWENVFHEAYTRPDIDAIARQADDFGGRIGRRKALPLLLTPAVFEHGRELLARAADAAQDAGDDDLLARIRILMLGLEHGELMCEAARFAIDRHYTQPTRFDDHWPLVERVHAVRENLGRQRAHNVFWLNSFELRSHDAYGTRVFYDFHNRPYVPVMTPPRDDWKFIPDPDGVGEAEGWFAQRMTPARALYGFEYPSYRHLFFSTWDRYQPVAGWKRRTGEEAVVNGWYQIEFVIPERDLQDGGLLYIPYIRGTAKIWIDRQLVREVTEEEGVSDAAITLSPAEIGIMPDEPFRLTIKVHSPAAPGGLIGPVYVARPSGVTAPW